MKRFLNETAAFLVSVVLVGVNRLIGRKEEAQRVWAEFLGLLEEGIEDDWAANLDAMPK